jgi:hypothetical protein
MQALTHAKKYQLTLVKNNEKKRFMHNSRQVTRTLLQQNLYSPQLKRNYACVHGGTLKPKAPKLPVNTTDVSGKHKLIFVTKCKQTDCEQINCANSQDPNQINPCGLPVTQNMSTIPSTAYGYETHLVGNTTSQEPSYLPGREIDPKINYTGNKKPQRMVEENPKIPVDSKDVKVDLQVSKYLQEQNHHDAIIK